MRKKSTSTRSGPSLDSCSGSLTRLRSGLNPSQPFIYGVLFWMTSAVLPGFVSGQEMVTDEMRFPYEAIVLQDGTSVYSGPANSFYATDRLKEGSLVQVHRHDPGGWCAIRPVKGSFSLVPEAALEIVDDNVGKVIVPEVNAWVGTRLGPVEKPMRQIKLREDELVKVLGEVSWPSPEGHATVWYQIAAPAGEFRWVKMSDLQLPPSAKKTPPQSSTQPATQSPSIAAVRTPAPSTFARATDVSSSAPALKRESPIVDTAESPDTTVPQPPRVSRVATTTGNSDAAIRQTGGQERSSPGVQLIQADDSLNAGWRPASKPFTSRPNSTARNASGANSFGSTSQSRPESQPESARKFTPPTVREVFAQPIRRENDRSAQSPRPDRFASAAPDAARARTNQTYQALPRIGGGPSNGSDSRNLRSHSTVFNNSNATPPVSRIMKSPSPDLIGIDLALSREIINPPGSWRLDELEQRTRANVFPNSPAAHIENANIMLAKIADCKKIQSNASETVGGTTLGQRSPIGSGVNRRNQFNSRYDATGWLKVLVQRNGTVASTYALQDANGEVTHVVAAENGVDLQSHLNSRVGIMGRMGFHRELQTSHVTAQRIVPLR